MGILHAAMGILHAAMGILLAIFFELSTIFFELSTIVIHTGRMPDVFQNKRVTMHAENLHTEYAENFNGYRNMKLFSEGGIAPSGECWVSPTAMFLRVWESPAGNRLKKQGFRLRNDGKQIGASQDRILVCPRQKA